MPKTEPVFHFRICLDYFTKIPIKQAQEMAFNELKKRKHISIEEFNAIQPELKSVVYFSGLIREIPELNQLLITNYGSN